MLHHKAVEYFTKKLQLQFFCRPQTRNQRRCKCLSSQRPGVPLRLFTVSGGRAVTGWGEEGREVWWSGGEAQWVTWRLCLLTGSLHFLLISAALRRSGVPQQGRITRQAALAPFTQFFTSPLLLFCDLAAFLFFCSTVCQI